MASLTGRIPTSTKRRRGDEVQVEVNSDTAFPKSLWTRKRDWRSIETTSCDDNHHSNYDYESLEERHGDDSMSRNNKRKRRRTTTTSSAAAGTVVTNDIDDEFEMEPADSYNDCDCDDDECDDDNDECDDDDDEYDSDEFSEGIASDESSSSDGSFNDDRFVISNNVPSEVNICRSLDDGNDELDESVETEYVEAKYHHGYNDEDDDVDSEDESDSDESDSDEKSIPARRPTPPTKFRFDLPPAHDLFLPRDLPTYEGLKYIRGDDGDGGSSDSAITSTDSSTVPQSPPSSSSSLVTDSSSHRQHDHPSQHPPKWPTPRVSFSPQVTVRPIYHFAIHAPHILEAMYTSCDELRTNKRRNKKEFSYEAHDWRQAVEEGGMARNEVTGGLVHPAHAMDAGYHWGVSFSSSNAVALGGGEEGGDGITNGSDNHDDDDDNNDDDDNDVQSSYTVVTHSRRMRMWH